MEEYEISQTEEQSLNIGLANEIFNLRLYAFRDLMYADVTMGEEYLVCGKRLIAGEWIIPPYYAKPYGNFRFESYESDSDEYVWYTGFNTKFRLVAYTAEEVEALG